MPTVSRREFVCEWCQVKFFNKYNIPKATTLRFCGRSCSAKWRMSLPHIKETVRRSVRVAQQSNVGRKRPDQSERMKTNNPSLMPGVREKMSATKEANGTLHAWKGERGGNGKINRHESLLAEALGAEWTPQLPIKTYCWNGSGYPACYKVDFGDPTTRTAIEVDGAGHKAPAVAKKDRKKEEKLRSLGWTVLRFTNAEVETDLASVLARVRSTVSKSRTPTTSSPTGF